jgi:hypothetical protein
MKSLKNILGFSLLSTAIVACGAQEPRSFTGLDRSVPTSKTAFVETFSPASGAVEVDANSQIRIEFSDRIREASIEGDTVWVESDLGVPPIRVRHSLSSDERVLILTPLSSGGRRMVFSPNTKYTVYTRYLEDVNGNLIPPFSWQFRTKPGNLANGNFKALGLLPEKKWISASETTLAIQFNEEVKRPPSGSSCNVNYYLNSIQVEVAQFLSNDGQTGVETDLDIQSICAVGSRLQIRFGELPTALIPQYLQIRVFPTAELTGALSQEMLTEQVVYRIQIFPTPEDIINTFLPGLDGLLP